MQKFKKILKYLAVAAIIVLAIDAAVVLGFSATRPKLQKADAIVILGAAINSQTLYNRSLQGLKLYEQGLAPVMVLSGGRISDKDISEANFMERIIDKNAKQPVNLILEDQSHSTYENIKNTKVKLPEAKSIIIVTDRYHFARAVLLAKKNFAAVTWSSPDVSYGPGEWLYHYGREIGAMLYYLPKFVWR